MTIMNENVRIRLWREMLRIRLFEQEVAARYPEQEMRCPVHLSVGQESVAVGISAHLNREDWVYSNHRAHAHYLAKGGDMIALIAEMYGLANGCVSGRGGSMHLMDLSVGFAGSTPIVGGTVPVATGAAWGMLLEKSNHCVVSYLGDGCFEEGVVYESLNVAALHQLPILYVLENNFYSVYTHLSKRQPHRKFTEVAEALGLKAFYADGSDVMAVYHVAAEALEFVRAGNGPAFVQCDTYRWLEHCGPYDDDHLGYRHEGELQRWQERCPIRRLQEEMRLSKQEVDAAVQSIRREIRAAWKQALAGLPPLYDPQEHCAYVD
ncbi:thiamine pyrophosphate-dependent dehydrogenase E1 component subunit alpha [Candidatus Parcubacteria bacterium]|nr:MAG: thiamine pyrophosphate-dependent dehydrogenase E1 component subunit alpha [Candidatus Parcubacteria bacterium]